VSGWNPDEITELERLLDDPRYDGLSIGVLFALARMRAAGRAEPDPETTLSTLEEYEELTRMDASEYRDLSPKGVCDLVRQRIAERERILAKRGTSESWFVIRRRIWTRDTGVCQVCQTKIALCDYQCGHIVDRMAGGSDRDDNLVVMSGASNQFKPVHDTRAAYDAWIEGGYWKREMTSLVKADPVLLVSLARFAASPEGRAFVERMERWRPADSA
jgi:hypothetical protein